MRSARGLLPCRSSHLQSSIITCLVEVTKHPYRKEHKDPPLVLAVLVNACLMFKQLSRQFVLRNSTRIQCHLFSSSSRLLVDPWPLPHTPEHLASTTSPADKPSLPPLPRLNETVETLRARLVYQSRKRGTLESDLLLSTFARDHLSSMTEVELKEYDKVC